MTYKPVKYLSTKDKKFTTTKQIVEIRCELCGYDRGILTHSSYASAGLVKCNNPECNHRIDEI
jgi:hypothetical protein